MSTSYLRGPAEACACASCSSPFAEKMGIEFPPHKLLGVYACDACQRLLAQMLEKRKPEVLAWLHRMALRGPLTALALRIVFVRLLHGSALPTVAPPSPKK